MHGLRGDRKTVRLNQIRMDANATGTICVPIEAPESRSLPAILFPVLRSSLIQLSRTQAAKAGVARIYGALASFAKAFKVKFEDIEFSIDLEPAMEISVIWILLLQCRTLQVLF